MFQVQKKTTILAILAALVLSGLGAAELRAQNRTDQFIAAFKKASAEKDYTKQRALVGQNKQEAFDGYFTMETELLKDRLAGNTEAQNKVYDTLTDLVGSYNLEFSDKILSDRLRWANALEGENAQARVDAYMSYQNAVQFHIEGDNGNEDAYNTALESYSNAFLKSYEIKDFYNAARASRYMASVFSSKNMWFESAYYVLWCKRCAVEGGFFSREEFAWIDPNLADLNEKRRVIFPELIDIAITDMDEAKKAHEEAKRKKLEGGLSEGTGEGPSNKSEGSGPKVPMTKVEYTWEEFKFKNTEEKDVWTKIKLPYWNMRQVGPQNGSKHPFYQYASFEKADKDKPEPKEFAGLPGGKVLYDGNLHFTTDVDKDKPRVKNSMGKFAINVQYDDGEKTKITHMMMDYESTRLSLFGEKFTASDAAKFTLIAWYGTTASTGKIHGHDVTIIDTNGNGLIRDTGEDSIIVGKGKNARVEPFGRFVFLPVENGWYPFEIKVQNKNGTDVRCRPFKGALAPIHVKYTTGTKHMPEYLIAKGTGEDVEFYFDLMKGLDPTMPIWVPVGSYEFYQGYFTFGSGKKETNILIGKGRSGLFKVEAGKMNTWELGGAGEKGFWMIGKCERNPQDKTEVICHGPDIRVYGSYGEEYFNFYEERVAPTVTLHKDGADGRKVAEEEMRFPSGSGITLASLWYPANCVLDKLSKNDELWAQLTAKHGVLGEIKSEWFRVID